ncbi:MAG: DUF5990 family protein [Planctomycetia bacterium]|nr:DUF5990 family protein [Planctomycetia bacterium]
MEKELSLRIVLIAPPAGVDFGLQHGKGSAYTTIQKQRSNGADLTFACTVTVKDNLEGGLPNFLGPLAQGPPSARFLYLDIGRLAGQADSVWERRIKVPLRDISWELIEQASAYSNQVLEVRLPGTGRDGGPNCATVHPTDGWKCCRRLA